MGDIDFSPEISAIFDKYILRWGGSYSIGAIQLALKEITEMYDRKCGSYPEHAYEGYAFLHFCMGKTEPWDYRDYEKGLDRDDLRER